MMKAKIKKDDYVQVMSGEDKNKRGKILWVFPDKNQVIVEGVNYIFKHVRKSQKNMQGGRIQKEAPIHISKIKLYCPHCQIPTRAFFAYEEEKEEKAKGEESATPKTGVKIRCCKKCKRHI